MSSTESPGQFVIADVSKTGQRDNIDENESGYGRRPCRSSGSVLVETQSNVVAINENKGADCVSSPVSRGMASSPIMCGGDTRDDISSNDICFETPKNHMISSQTRENASFSENDRSFPIFSPTADSEFLNTENIDESNVDSSTEEQVEEEAEEETEEERIRREQEESEALARQMMAEEAMASYQMSADFLRDNADNYSEEDLAALQAAMAEEDPEAEEELEEGPSAELSYDTLLRLGERLGDVKQERWTMVAKEKIEQLPTFGYSSSQADKNAEDDSTVRCLVCQCHYEEGEQLRRLPCGHCFHVDCVDQWLMNKDFCPYCRQSIV